MHPAKLSESCNGCELPARREFVLRVAASLASVAFLIGARDVMALDIEPTMPHATDGSRKSYDVPASDGVRFDKESEVILVRQHQSLWAFALSCPHQNTALKWNEKAQRFQCPKHDSRYRPDGAFIEGRATRAMDRYAIAVEGASVLVNLDKLYQQDTDPNGWNAATVTLP
jgi:nitrite reductase/ring-hydroxylating ferredoxin subunit